jgi:hypothetical protein
MMKDSIKIPSYVIAALRSCLTANNCFLKSKAQRLLAADEKTNNWFKAASEVFAAEITPELVYYTAIKQELDAYKPKLCLNCGKLLNLRAVKESRPFCSSRCNLSSSATQEKRKAGFLEKYGVTSHFHLASVKEKQKAAWIEKYGVDNPSKSKRVREKTKATLQNKYGVDNVFQLQEVKDRILPLIRKAQHEKYYDSFRQVLENSSVDYLSSKEDYVNCKPIILQCRHCKTIWITSPNGQAEYLKLCPNCFDGAGSNLEKELCHYIESIYSGKIIRNSRSIIKPQELDIYLPEKKLAFEFNGTYWHSESAGTSRLYHFNKTKACKEKGIKLIHIFEHEWVNSKDKIKALIRSALGIFSEKIYARKCQVKPISSKEYSQFLDAYHLQGSVNSSIRYGLYYQNDLVSVIGFGKSRFKKNELELYRYCVKSDYQIIGGFSKLIKHACKYTSIDEFISYVDLAHFNGQGYKKVGFRKVSVTAPSYIYVKAYSVLSRQQAQKHLLPALLGSTYDSSLSESQNMQLAGYYKVYDVGNLKVAYTVHKTSV